LSRGRGGVLRAGSPTPQSRKKKSKVELARHAGEGRLREVHTPQLHQRKKNISGGNHDEKDLLYIPRRKGHLLLEKESAMERRTKDDYKRIYKRRRALEDALQRWGKNFTGPRE